MQNSVCLKQSRNIETKFYGNTTKESKCSPASQQITHGVHSGKQICKNLSEQGGSELLNLKNDLSMRFFIIGRRFTLLTESKIEF